MGAAPRPVQPRYEPDAWTAAIDLDRSPLAVDLQRVLELAAEQAPARILQTLRAVATAQGT